MGMNSLVRKQVDLAFNKVGDLAKDITLTSKTTTGFNFTTGEKQQTDNGSKIIKGLLVMKRRSRADKENRPTVAMEMIFKATDLDTPDYYDIATMPDGSVWRFVPPVRNDGFLVTVDVVKEA